MKSVRGFFSKERYVHLFAQISKHEVFLLGSSLAYTTALALAPFIIIMISLISMLNFGDQHLLVQEIRDLLGHEAGRVIDDIVKNANQETHFRGLSGLIGFLVLVFSASAIFSQLRTSFDKINEFETPATENGILAFLKQRVFSVGLVLGFIFLLMSSLVVTSAIAALLAHGEGWLWESLSLTVNFLIFTLLFAAMFRFIPSKGLGWRDSMIAGVSAAIFFLVGKFLIGLYLGRSAVGSAYGAAGSLIALLIWLYYTSLTLLVSYEFTKNVLLDEPQAPNASP